MIVFLYGPDDYRREGKKRSIIGEFEKKNSVLSVGLFDLLQPDAPKALRLFLRSRSIFEKKKLAVIENGFEPEVRDELAEIVEPFAGAREETILFSEKKSPVKRLGFLLEKPVLSQAFESLAGAEWELFIRTEARKSGLSLDDEAVRFLAQVYAGNTWGLVTEIQKMQNLRQDISAKPLTRKDLDLFDLEVTPNYFAVLNSLKGAEVRNRLWALEKMLAMGDPPPKIFNILASQWRERTPLMAEYDLMVKSGRLEYEEALVGLVLG